jgi:dienelactone hydrolase
VDGAARLPEDESPRRRRLAPRERGAEGLAPERRRGEAAAPVPIEDAPHRAVAERAVPVEEEDVRRRRGRVHAAILAARGPALESTLAPEEVPPVTDPALVALLALAVVAAAGCAAAPAEGPPAGPGDAGPGGREHLPEVRGAGRAPSDDLVGPPPLRHYLGARAASGASLSPDGLSVAYLDGVTGSPQVWRLDGGTDRAPARPVQVTSFAERATLVRWLPTGDRLLLGGDVGGDEREDLLVTGPDGTGAVVLARGAEGRHQPGGFTPDGARLVYASTRRHPSFFDLWVADTRTGESRMLLQDDAMNGAGEVSPDGARVITVRSHGSFRQELGVVDLATGARLDLLPGAPPCRFQDPHWEPDGSAVLALCDLGRDHLALFRFPLDGSPPELLHGPEADIDSLAVSRPTGWLAWTVNDRGWSRLEAWKPGMAEPRVLLHRGRVGSAPVFADAAPALALGWSDGGRPPSLLRLVVREARGEPEVLVPPALPGLDASTFVVPREVRFPSFDGLEISGFLYRPARGSRSCVVLVHGGPEGQYRPGWDGWAQYLVARGHAVFAPNVRGSTGYGRRFATLDDARLRMDSVKDLAAVHAWLAWSGVADPDRIAVMGGSYGGFLTLAALTHQPELWAAGVDIVGIAHLGTFLRNTGAYRQRHRAAEYGDPVADADFFEATAPLRHAHRIRAPLLVIHGRNDPRVPVSEAEQIVAAARGNGAAVELLVFEDEGHGMAKLKNRLEGHGRAAEFLDRALAAPSR